MAASTYSLTVSYYFTLIAQSIGKSFAKLQLLEAIHKTQEINASDRLMVFDYMSKTCPMSIHIETKQWYIS